MKAAAQRAERAGELQEQARRRDQNLRPQDREARGAGHRGLRAVEVVQTHATGGRDVGVQLVVVLEHQGDVEPADPQQHVQRNQLAQDGAHPQRPLLRRGDEDAGLAGRARAQAEAVAGLRRDSGLELEQGAVLGLLERETERVAFGELGGEVARGEQRQTGERVVDVERASEPGQQTQTVELVALDTLARPAPPAAGLPVGADDGGARRELSRHGARR